MTLCSNPGQKNCYSEVGYLARHPDLQKAFVQNGQIDWAALQNHWITQRGNRNARMLPQCGNTGGIPELVNAPIDPCYYRNTYPDLKNAFGSDYKRLIGHWFANGIREGRSGSPKCSLPTQAGCYNEVAYLTRYPDLQNAFVAGGQVNWAALESHWQTNGFREGRNAKALAQCAAAGGLAELKGKPIDPCYYLNKYPDLKGAFGNNLKRAVSHWFTNGKAEGRTGGVP